MTTPASAPTALSTASTVSSTVRERPRPVVSGAATSPGGASVATPSPVLLSVCATAASARPRVNQLRARSSVRCTTPLLRGGSPGVSSP